MKDENSKPKKKISDSHFNQISVLRSLYAMESALKEPKAFQIDEIAERSGLSDEREIQRYLFILEGQKLVSPQPEGDFTSKTWVITANGIRTLRTIEQSAAA